MANNDSSTLSVLRDAGTRTRPLRILFADDVRELRDVARIFLTREGHAIECVADGELALARVLEDRDFDLVITDHHMPNLNGLELVTRLREIVFPGRIMVFSSELGDLVTRQYQALKVDRILYKPVFPSMLRAVLAELFPLPAKAA
ncbi:MAG: response regulator [Opitutaceae bacterium]|nr:response regulator [Opitutaceae bacterium]